MENSYSMANTVVDPVKMPKVKAKNSVIAGFNAASISLACFMGFVAIFAGIAAFTKKGWGIDIPFAGTLFGTNTVGAGYSVIAFAAGIATVLFGVVGLITAGKITDIDAMKKSWRYARNAFIAIAAIEVIKMVSIAIYSLCGIGEKSGVQQGYLWLNGFLSNTLAAMAAVGMVFIAHAISEGKTAVLSVMRFVALGIASVACVLIFVSTIVSFYSNKTSLGGSSSSSSSSSSLDSWLDLLK